MKDSHLHKPRGGDPRTGKDQRREGTGDARSINPLLVSAMKGDIRESPQV